MFYSSNFLKPWKQTLKEAVKFIIAESRAFVFTVEETYIKILVRPAAVTNIQVYSFGKQTKEIKSMFQSTE